MSPRPEMPDAPCPRIEVLVELRAMAKREGIVIEGFRLDPWAFLAVMAEQGGRAIHQRGPDNTGVALDTLSLLDANGDFTVTAAGNWVVDAVGSLTVADTRGA